MNHINKGASISSSSVVYAVSSVTIAVFFSIVGTTAFNDLQRFVRSDSERMAETNNLIPTGRGHYEASVSLKAKHYAALTGTEHATACYEL